MRSIHTRSLPGRAAFVTGALSLAFLAASAPMLKAQDAAATPDRRPTLFVVDFRVSAIGQQSDYAPLGQGIADLLVSELAQNPAIRVVDRENLHRILQEQDLSQSNRIDDATAVQVGRILGAHHFIKGSIMVDPRGRVRLDAHAVSTETSGIEHVETVTGNGDDVMELLAQLSEKLNKGLNLPELPAVASRPSDNSGANAAGSASAAPATNASTSSSQVASNESSPSATPAAPSAGGSAAPARKPAAAKKANFQAVMLYSRALAEEDKGNRAAAVELYRKSLAAFPNYENAKARLARLERSGS